MLQYRRLSALVLGIWLGAGIFADIAVTQNFQAVDRFLAEPNSAATSIELNKIGHDRERVILRRNAAEENNVIFENWERAELVLGAVLFGILFFGSRPSRVLIAAPLLMLFIVTVQHFFLTPEIADMGRLPVLTSKFWVFHGIYSGAEIVKLLIGAALGVRLSLRRRQDPEHFVKEYARGSRLG